MLDNTEFKDENLISESSPDTDYTSGEDIAEDKTKLCGMVEEIIFRNAQNGYTVLVLSSDKYIYTLSGTMPDLSDGLKITAYGKFKKHPDYGEQFAVSYYEVSMPSEETEIENYLASGILPYVGRATARKIVELFGVHSLDVIENEPEKLAAIRGISKKKADEINKKYLEQIGIKEIIMFFQRFGISPALAARAFKTLGPNTLALVKQNPYILADETSGFTFSTADEIAKKLDFPKNAPERVKSYLRYTLTNAAYSSGHTFLPQPALVSNARAALELSEDDVLDALSELLMSEILVKDKHTDYDAIYHRMFFNAEKNVAEILKELSSVYFDENQSQTDSIIEEVEKETGIILEESQRKAVESTFTNSVMVITGGPGTGKTTIINTIIRSMEKLNMRVKLTAPTGRAAKRISEVSGADAKTIHRLLECNSDTENGMTNFAKNENNKLECDVLIVDETSMVDILLMQSLLLALPKGIRLIFVGDADQLPSVGAGNVLRDIINSEMVLTIKLTKIFRQAQESMIVVNAHRINSGDYPFLNDFDNDFFLVKRTNVINIPDTVCDLAAARLPLAYGFDRTKDIQVLSVTKKGEMGVYALNNALQARLNPPSPDKPEKISSSCIFRLGDKVMQIKNNYNMPWRKEYTDEKGTGIFNGDIGYITNIDSKNRNLTVLFDDRIVVYDFLMLDELELAYAMTVHKSQGSEFEAVILPIFDTHRLLMSRNILYTAVTRAKKLVVLVGTEETLSSFIRNNSTISRYSGLKDRLYIY